MQRTQYKVHSILAKLVLLISFKCFLVLQEKADLQKNPGSDSAVSVGSSDEEEECEEQRHITKYFDYLNENDFDGGSSQRRKKKKKTSKETNKTTVEEKGSKNESITNNNDKNTKFDNKKKDRPSRKGEFEKDIRHIERHLSMKKTIRKKMMRDLQQAFVEDPKDLQQDPKGLTDEKKHNIDINNLTFSKNRLSKSEHNFLDMLKDEQPKERKGLRGLFTKDKPTEPKDNDIKTDAKPNTDCKLSVTDIKSNSETQNTPTKTTQQSHEENHKSSDKIRDDDSGHGSPTREPRDNFTKRSKSKDDLLDLGDEKESSAKRQSFWKRITGKGKAKR